MQEILTTSRLRLDIFKVLAAVFLILLLLIIYILNLAQSKSYDKFNDDIHKYIHKTIQHTLSHNINQYESLLTRLIHIHNIPQHVVKQDREGLYEILKPRFDLMQKENPYFETLNIITKDGKAFLRVHAKEDFGDDCFHKRPMVQKIMKTQKSIIGYETGLHSNAFRIMIPLYNGKEFLGSVGIGINPNYFIEKISELIDEKGMLFLEDTGEKLFSTNIDFTLGQYRLQTKVDTQSEKLLQAVPHGYNFEEPFTLELNNKTYYIHSESIKGFNGEILGKYIFFQDFSNRLSDQNNIQMQVIISVILFALVIFIFVGVIIMKFSKELELYYCDIITTMQENKSYLKAVENGSNDLIFTLSHQKLITANKVFLEFMGYNNLESFKKAEKSICDYFVKRVGYISKFIEDKMWFEYMMTHPDRLHKVIVKKDQKEYIFKVNVSKVKIDNKFRYLCMFSDITEIETIKNRYEFAINGAQDGIWDWDLLTNKIYFTPQWKKQLGYEDADLKNSFSTWDKHVHPEDKEQVLKDVQANQTKETLFYENIHRLRHKDGHWVWILDRGQTLFDEDGVAIRMIGAHTDISKMKKLENEIKEKDTLMVTQSRNAAMGEMISMIAHQWRQPLAVISMDANNIMADIELDMVEYESLKEISLEIIDQTKELSKTIDDFKEFFKPVKESEMVLVEEIFKKAFSVVGKSLENNNVSVVKKFHSKHEIDTYSRELMQVFINLLNNAKEVLVEKDIQEKQIVIEINDTLDSVVIKVCDNGGGISKNIIEKIFDPYFSTKDVKTGTGLGLYMSKTIIEKHLSGTLVATNENEGACFTMKLPFVKLHKKIEDK